MGDGCHPVGLARLHGRGTHVASFTETTTHGSHTVKSMLSGRIVKSWWKDAVFLNFLPRHTLTFKQRSKIAASPTQRGTHSLQLS